MINDDTHLREKTFIDLFAGCGGLSLGMEEAGFVPILVNELNKDAMDTYLLNRDHINSLLRSKYNFSDVKELVLDEILLNDIIQGLSNDYKIDIINGDLDLLVGGPPCQGFSGIGHRRSYSVDKKQLPSNYLFQDMVYLITKFRPKLFLFENVKGLLSSRWSRNGSKGEIWDEVKDTFQSLPDYHVRWDLVYAKDYGVPQNRPRVLLVGVREDTGIKIKSDNESARDAGLLPLPTNNYPSLEVLLSDLVDPDYHGGGVTTHYPSRILNEVQHSLRYDSRNNKLLEKGDVLTEQEYSRHGLHIVEKFRYMIEHNGEILPHMKTKKFAQRVLPSTWGDNGPSITATSLPDDYVHYSQPRILTVREWARLQLFPDWYQFAGKRTTGGLRRAGNPRKGIHEREVPKYTQIGNAVPVGLARAVGRHFMQILEKSND